MRVAAFLLCDAASARDNFLSVLNGGITDFVRPSFPDRLEATAAVMLVFSLSELRTSHDVVVSIELDGEEPHAKRTAAIGATSFPPDIDDDVEVPFAIAAPIEDFPLPKEGKYTFRLRVDGKELAMLRGRSSTVREVVLPD